MAQGDPQLYVPPGRFVFGSLTQKRTMDNNRRPIEEKKQQFEIGIAIRKDSPEAGNFFGQLINGAKHVWAANPQAAQMIDNWLQNGLNGFSMKVSDGDKPSVSTGQVNQNTAGCWVIYMASSFSINTANAQNIQIDPSMIERGYYVDATATISSNNQQPPQMGIYVNPGLIRMIGVGEVINTGPSVEQMAASMPTAPQLPPGAQPANAAPPVSTPPPGVAPAPQQTAPAPQQTAPAPQPVPNGAAPTQMPPGVQPQQPNMQPGVTSSPGNATAPQPPYPGIIPGQQ